VFNFDVPTHAEDYVHRIGRTGRAGLSGHAYTLAAPEDGKYIAGIERLAGKEIPRVKIEDLAGAALTEETGKDRGRGRGRGKAADKRPSDRPQEKPQETAPEKAPEKQRAKQSEKRPDKTQNKPQKEKDGKRGSRRGRDSIGDVPDYGDVPFGETDLVPAFLKRSG
jgi:superfamily II DNA/RNA helicase